MSEPMDTPIDAPEATNYPWMPVAYLDQQPPLTAADESVRRLAAASLALGLVGVGAVVVGLLVTPVLVLAAVVGLVAAGVGLVARRRVGEVVSPARRQSIVGTVLGVAVAVLAAGLLLAALL